MIILIESVFYSGLFFECSKNSSRVIFIYYKLGLMTSIHIESTSITPEVKISKGGELVFRGNSMPLYPESWYADVFKWLEDYAKTNPTVLDIQFKFSYINTGTARMVKKISYIIEQNYNLETCKVKVVWFCADEDMEELAELLKENAKFNFVIDKTKIEHRKF
jgi:hypothetical protein